MPKNFPGIVCVRLIACRAATFLPVFLNYSIVFSRAVALYYFNDALLGRRSCDRWNSSDAAARSSTQ